jgi:aminoglycoside 3-N-acetyltransferase
VSKERRNRGDEIMTTKKDIIQFLESIDVKHDDTVLIHTSLKAIGELDGGADMLIDAFCEYLHQGLFLIPTHTWDSVVADKPFYDVRTTKPCVGALTSVAVKRKDGVRSLHPTHSIVAFGTRAREYIKGEEMSASPAPIGGCWSRLYDEHAKILLIGVGHDKNTYFHAVDEMLHIPNRLSDNAFTITIKDENDKTHTTPPYHTHLTKGIACCCSEFYPNYKKPLEELSAVIYSKLGAAIVYCCDAVKCSDIIRRLWDKTDHDLCIGEEEIPATYYLDLK